MNITRLKWKITEFVKASLYIGGTVGVFLFWLVCACLPFYVMWMIVQALQKYINS